MKLQSTKKHENIRYSSLWKRKVRRDFSCVDIIIKSPLSPLCQEGYFRDNASLPEPWNP
jgi:hypothetical protein